MRHITIVLGIIALGLSATGLYGILYNPTNENLLVCGVLGLLLTLAFIFAGNKDLKYHVLSSKLSAFLWGWDNRGRQTIVVTNDRPYYNELIAAHTAMHKLNKRVITRGSHKLEVFLLILDSNAIRVSWGEY